MAMAAFIHNDALLDRLPAARGHYEVNADLSGKSWFRTGGPAEVLFEPEDAEDLQLFLAERPSDVPVTVIGFGSNLLVRDGGIDGVVVVLGDAFTNVAIDGTTVTAGAAAIDVNVARAARDNGVAGLEFLSGVPGTIGGAIRMNAGAYGGEIADVAIDATVLDDEGGTHVMNASRLDFSYRHSAVPEGWVVISARLLGEPGDTGKIADRMAAIAAMRGESQPRTRTGGSTFVNPPGRKAWELIEQAGCRGLRRGGAMVSEQHCNFLLNTGTATSADLELLGEEIRCQVLEKTGVQLEWEIRRIGRSLRGGETQ